MQTEKQQKEQVQEQFMFSDFPVFEFKKKKKKCCEKYKRKGKRCGSCPLKGCA
jgi:hypothetical protein